MFGIGLGTKFAHRLSGFLWAVEGGIGLFAIIFMSLSPLLESLLFTHIPSGGIGLSILISCLVLACPAFLIGVSLPLFAAYLKEMVGGQVFGICYMVYNFGAAVTAILIEFFLIREFGISRTVKYIGLINICICLILFIRKKHITTPDLRTKGTIEYPAKILAPLILLSITSAIFQLISLKLSEFIFGPYNETFAMVLSIVLMGIAIGTLLHYKFRISFLTFLFINLTYFIILIPAFEPILNLYAEFYMNFHGMGLTIWKFFILFLIMGCGSICFGAAIPALIEDESNIAKEAGKLLYVSSLSNVTGYLLMVFILHSLFEYGQMIIVLTLLLATAIMITAWANKQIGVIAFLIALSSLPLIQRVWNEDLLYLDYTAFADREQLLYAMNSYEKGNRYRKFDETFAINTIDGDDFFFINGYTSIELNSPAEYIVGVLSALVTPHTKNGLVLGLGSGATAGTIGEIFDEVDVVEISPIIIEKQSLMKAYNFNINEKKHIKIFSDDGIRYVKSVGKKYDLILNTVTSPLYFSSSKLYTRDFFEYVKKKLQPDGIYTTWLDYRVGEQGVQIILKTLQKEFSHCWIGQIKDQYMLLLCSNTPIKLHQEEKIYNNKKLKEYFFSEYNRQIHTFRYAFVSSNAYEVLPTTSIAPINSIDLPELEYEISGLSDPDLRAFIRNIKIKYTVNALNKNIFKNSPLNFYDMVTYNLQLGRSSSFSRFAEKLASRYEKDFSNKIKSHILSIYQNSIEEFPNPNSKKRFASWLSHYKEYAKAEKMLEEILKEDPDYYDIRYKIAHTYLHQSKNEEAIEMFKKELKKNPNHINAMYWLGRIYLKLNKYSEAVKWFEYCLNFDPWFNNANYYAGIACLKDGNKVRSVSFFRQELKVDPEDEKPLPYLK